MRCVLYTQTEMARKEMDRRSVARGKRDSLDYEARRRKSPMYTYALTWEGAGNGVWFPTVATDCLPGPLGGRLS